MRIALIAGMLVLTSVSYYRLGHQTLQSTQRCHHEAASFGRGICFCFRVPHLHSLNAGPASMPSPRLRLRAARFYCTNPTLGAGAALGDSRIAPNCASNREMFSPRARHNLLAWPGLTMVLATSFPCVPLVKT